MEQRVVNVCNRAGLTRPDEPTPDHMVGGGGNCHHYGVSRWESYFPPRQMLYLMSLIAAARELSPKRLGLGEDYAIAMATLLGVFIDRQADYI